MVSGTDLRWSIQLLYPWYFISPVRSDQRFFKMEIISYSQRSDYDLKEPTPMMIMPIWVIDKYIDVHLEVGVSPSVFNKCWRTFLQFISTKNRTNKNQKKDHNPLFQLLIKPITPMIWDITPWKGIIVDFLSLSDYNILKWSNL